jgi:hypothetical protein
MLPLLLLSLAAAAERPRADAQPPHIQHDDHHRTAARTAYRAPPRFTVEVSATGGGVMLTSAAGSVTVDSRFSSPGPRWSTLSGAATSGGAGRGWSELHVVPAGEGRWNVSAEGPSMSLARTVTVRGDHVVVADTLTAHGNASEAASSLPVAIQTEHNAQFTENVTVTSAELPGVLYPFSCSTIENQDEYETDGLSYGAENAFCCAVFIHRTINLPRQARDKHRENAEKRGWRFLAGSFGNPAVYMQSATFGVGLLPLDDVFQIHGVSTQAALAVYPRGPNPGCAVRKNALF